jgi:prophage regulatory protein
MSVLPLNLSKGAAMNDDTSPRFVSLNQTCAMTSLSRTAINMRRAAGTFPQPVALDGRRIAFVREEVEGWIRDRIAAGRVRPPKCTTSGAEAA